MTDKTAYYLPEAIGPYEEGDRWTVVRDPDTANGGVNFRDKIVSLPPGHISPGTDAIRAHEGGHKKYTDPRGPGGRTNWDTTILGMLVAMFDETRIDALLLAHHTWPDGRPVDVLHRHDDTDFEKLLAKLSMDDPKQLALMYLQFFPTRESEKVRPTFKEISKRLADAGHRALLGDLEAYALGVAIRAERDGAEASGQVRDDTAKYIADTYFPEKLPDLPKMEFTPDIKEAIAEAIEESEKESGVGPGGGVNVTGTGTHDPRERPGTMPPERAHTAAGVTDLMGLMQICDHTRPGLKTRMVKTPNGATDRGTDINHIERYAEDMAIFKHRRPGGAVLIDCSGSMKWPLERLQMALIDLPSTTIALYQGVQNGLSDALKYERVTTRAELEARNPGLAAGTHDYNGRLCIIAKNGRIAPFVKEDDLSGGNDVDYEALTWLAAQPGPRLWLSDGQVCGGHIEATDSRMALLQMCGDLIKRSLIWRTVDVDGGIRYLKKGVGRPGEMPS